MILFLADVRVKVNRKTSSVQNDRRRYGNLRDQKQKHGEGRRLGFCRRLGTRILRNPDAPFGLLKLLAGYAADPNPTMDVPAQAVSSRVKPCQAVDIC